MKQYPVKSIDTVTRPMAPRQRRGLQRGQRVLIGAVCLVLVITGIGVYWWVHRGEQRPLADHYQAVYMTNGQMYFGKLQNTQGDYLTLTNVYTPQTSTGSQDSSATKSETSLVKVTQQVYGPDNSVALRSNQVQFWQNLRDDSKVVQAIKSSN